MKVKLNEKTLNAYINEAIRQELNEAYKVDFGAMGRANNQATRSFKTAKKRLERGSYGRLGLRTANSVIRKLRKMGYSDEQIQKAIRDGSIRYGKFDGQNDVTAKNLRKQNRVDARLHTDAGIRVNDYGVNMPETPGQPQQYPWDTEITPEEVAAAKAEQQKARRQRTQRQPAPVQQQPAPVQQPAQPQQRTPVSTVNPNPTNQISLPGVTNTAQNQQTIIRESLVPDGVYAGAPAPFRNDRAEVEKFQAWFNKKMGGNLVIDGIWGPKTQAAWDQWVRQAYPSQQNESRVGKTQIINEIAFKNLVKQTLTELLK